MEVHCSFYIYIYDIVHFNHDMREIEQSSIGIRNVQPKPKLYPHYLLILTWIIQSHRRLTPFETASTSIGTLRVYHITVVQHGCNQ